MTMDDPSTLRRKAARLHERATSSASAQEATKLHEAAHQLELWADDFEESPDARQNSSHPGNETRKTEHRPALREQTLVLAPDGAVALAGSGLQALAVDDGDAAVRVADEAGGPEGA